MSTRHQYDDETTHERPSSFREMLYRDRRLVSRRQMDRLIRDRAADRADRADLDDADESYASYFPALRRVFSGGPAAEARAVVLVIILVVGAFLFGRWVGQQDADESTTQSAGVVRLI
jgi:hypothetical protein